MALCIRGLQKLAAGRSTVLSCYLGNLGNSPCEVQFLFLTESPSLQPGRAPSATDRVFPSSLHWPRVSGNRGSRGGPSRECVPRSGSDPEPLGQVREFSDLPSHKRNRRITMATQPNNKAGIQVVQMQPRGALRPPEAGGLSAGLSCTGEIRARGDPAGLSGPRGQLGEELRGRSRRPCVWAVLSFWPAQWGAHTQRGGWGEYEASPAHPGR